MDKKNSSGSGSIPRWNAKPGPDGNKFLNRVKTKLKEGNNECFLVDARDMPDQPDEPQKRPKDFGRKVIIHPETNEPMRAVGAAGVPGDYISDPDNDAVVAAYEDTDMEPIYDYVLSAEAEKRFDTYRKDQKAIREQWERWETKVNEFFTFLGQHVPEHVQTVYKEFLEVRYPKGAMDALQDYVNPPSEQGGYLGLYGQIIESLVKGDLMAWAAKFQEDIDALSEVGENVSDKLKKFLLVNAIRKGPRAETFRTTLETLSVSKGKGDYAYWLKTLAAAETREANFSAPGKKARAMYVNNNVNDNSIKLCIACGQDHPEDMHNCPNTWYCRDCRWRHLNECDNKAARRKWEAEIAAKKPAANQGKQNPGKKGKPEAKGKPDQKDGAGKKEKYATTGQIKNMSAQLGSLKNALAAISTELGIPQPKEDKGKGRKSGKSKGEFDSSSDAGSN
jgi:hypothetical protein